MVQLKPHQWKDDLVFLLSEQGDIWLRNKKLDPSSVINGGW